MYRKASIDEWRRIEGADRMGPGSLPEAVDRESRGFLAHASWHRDPEPTAAFRRPVFHCRAEAVSL